MSENQTENVVTVEPPKPKRKGKRKPAKPTVEMVQRKARSKNVSRADFIKAYGEVVKKHGDQANCQHLADQLGTGTTPSSVYQRFAQVNTWLASQEGVSELRRLPLKASTRRSNDDEALAAARQLMADIEVSS